MGEDFWIIFSNFLYFIFLYPNFLNIFPVKIALDWSRSAHFHF